MVWQIILEEIGKGILSGVGSNILDNVLGGGRRQPDLATILAEALREFADDIKQSIQDALDKAEYKEAVNSMRIAQRAIRQYNQSPGSRKDLLDEITFQLTTSLTNMEALGVRGLSGYMICAGMEVVMLQERQSALGGNELHIAVCDTVRSAEIHWLNMHDALLSWNESRFSRVYYNPLFGRDGETVLHYWVWYTFEGRRFSSVASPNDFGNAPLESKRVEHIKREWNSIYAGTEPIRNSLENLKVWAEKTKIDCSQKLPQLQPIEAEEEETSSEAH
ncbi:hypothetical protein [Spartinivicinus poritis]|uniref:Uncharacterized protein n=1 Tax=Spartinivicinus poritis TaxID=2994640 RepID=A0ABT5U3M9_9GAMM|nr:hypothetical protein [Spartinivicinus sp. A2-2]MDE1460922.1 hypothetical protein [Spartinivicinus sp. A2-2]